jgi:hypothetical protein
MLPAELRERIEADFKEYGKLEDAQLEEILEEHEHVKEELLDSKEEEEISHFLQETRGKFNELMGILSRLEGTISPETESRIINLSKDVYIDAMLALHLTRDYDLRNPEVRGKLLRGAELEEATPPESLYKKIKVHFLLGELYFALGIRISTELKDRGAAAEFKKVTGEGIHLYDNFLRCREKDPKKSLATIKIVRDIAMAYTRLSVLYTKEGKQEKTRSATAQAHGWFTEMFNMNNANKDPFDVNKIFSSEEAFRRYLTDLQSTNSPCVFQYEKDGKIICIGIEDTTGNLCPHKKDDSCSYALSKENLVEKALAAREDDSYS